MANFRDIFKNFLLLGLIVFAIFGFAINLYLDNDEGDAFGDDPTINGVYSDLSSNLGGLRDKSQSQNSLFNNDNPTSGASGILLLSIVNIGQTFNGIIISIFNIVIKLPVIYLGLPEEVVSILIGLLIFSMIIGLWAIYKYG